MSLISDEEKKSMAKEWFEGMEREVLVTLYTKNYEIVPAESPGTDMSEAAVARENCRKASNLLREMESLSRMIRAEEIDFGRDPERIIGLGITSFPAFSVSLHGETPRVFYYGIPYGYQFHAFVKLLVWTSGRRIPIDVNALANIAILNLPCPVKIFIVASSEYSYGLVMAFYKFAIANASVKVEVVDARIFTREATMAAEAIGRDFTQSLPLTVIGDFYLIGTLPEDELAVRCVRHVNRPVNISEGRGEEAASEV